MQKNLPSSRLVSKLEGASQSCDKCVSATSMQTLLNVCFEHGRVYLHVLVGPKIQTVSLDVAQSPGETAVCCLLAAFRRQMIPDNLFHLNVSPNLLHPLLDKLSDESDDSEALALFMTGNGSSFVSKERCIETTAAKPVISSSRTAQQRQKGGLTQGDDNTQVQLAKQTQADATISIHSELSSSQIVAAESTTPSLNPQDAASGRPKAPHLLQTAKTHTKPRSPDIQRPQLEKLISDFIFQRYTVIDGLEINKYCWLAQQLCPNATTAKEITVSCGIITVQHLIDEFLARYPVYKPNITVLMLMIQKIVKERNMKTIDVMKVVMSGGVVEVTSILCDFCARDKYDEVSQLLEKKEAQPTLNTTLTQDTVFKQMNELMTKRYAALNSKVSIALWWTHLMEKQPQDLVLRASEMRNLLGVVDFQRFKEDLELMNNMQFSPDESIQVEQWLGEFFHKRLPILGQVNFTSRAQLFQFTNVVPGVFTRDTNFKELNAFFGVVQQQAQKQKINTEQKEREEPTKKANGETP